MKIEIITHCWHEHASSDHVLLRISTQNSQDRNIIYDWYDQAEEWLRVNIERKNYILHNTSNFIQFCISFRNKTDLQLFLLSFDSIYN